MTFGTWRWWGCQSHSPAAFTPRKYSWYSFTLGAESTPGPWYVRKEYVTKKTIDTTGNRSRDPPTSSAAVYRLVPYVLPWYSRIWPSRFCTSCWQLSHLTSNFPFVKASPHTASCKGYRAYLYSWELLYLCYNDSAYRTVCSGWAKQLKFYIMGRGLLL